jgi:hypothetical protein
MLQKPSQINPMTRMWLIDDNSHLLYQLLEFQKVVEMEIIMVFGICTR